MKNRTLFVWLFSLCAQALLADTLTIEACYELAKQYYPLARQKELLEKSREYSIANASKGYLPQVALYGQASHQSEVTQIPLRVPGITVPELNKDQYKIYGEVNQPLSDVLIINQQKELIKANSAVEDQKTEVELYKLKERINQLFFGILLIDEQLVQAGLLKKDIQTGIDKMTAAVDNGTALKSSVDILSVELLKTEQRSIELKSARKSFITMMGLFINRSLDESAVFEKPAVKIAAAGVNRPELMLFENQKKSLDIQNKLLTAKNMPRLVLFFQEGYGRPALNMLSNDFDIYYIGGIRLSWSFTGFYTFKKDKKLLDLSRSLLDVQQEVFLFNTKLTLQQQNDEMSKLGELMKVDQDILALRGKIKNALAKQLENGVATSNDYLREVNAEDQAKQNLLLHQMQLLMAQYNYLTTSGN